MPVCDLVVAIPVVVAVVGLIAWMAIGFEEASRENDWPSLRRPGEKEDRMNGSVFGYRIDKVEGYDTHPFRVTRYLALATGEGVDVVIGYRATLVDAAELILEDARKHERGEVGRDQG